MFFSPPTEGLGLSLPLGAPGVPPAREMAPLLRATAWTTGGHWRGRGRLKLPLAEDPKAQVSFWRVRAPV